MRAYPIMIEMDLTEDMEVLDAWKSVSYPGAYTMAIHDHSLSWGDAEIFETLFVPFGELRYMWE